MRSGSLVPSRIVGAVVAALVAAPALLPVRAPAQGAGGLDVFRTHCDGCHDLPDPESPHRTKAEWEAVLNKMVKEKGAALNKQEFSAVLGYLDSFNQPAREVRWKGGPAATHRAVFDPKQAGRLPDPWVSVSTGSQADHPWALQADAAGRQAFLAPSRGAADGEQLLLLDNSGSLTSGTVTARLRIARGKGPTGAGVVFGFRSPQSFLGARLSPTTKDLILYDVEQGERALIGRAPAAVAADQWVVLALALSPKQVQLSLNGKTALTRPLERYKGGRVGLATEGATVAGFDQWAVEVR